MTSPGPVLSAQQLLSHGQLARLLLLRWLAVLCMVLAAWLMPVVLAVNLPQRELLAVAASLAAFNLLTLARSSARRTPSALMLWGQLLVDLLAWSVFVYFSGGATNPLISLLLPLVAIGAAILPAALGWALAVLAVLAYSLLWQFNVPIRFVDHDAAMHWHLAGMWVTFGISALVVAWFVLRAAGALRRLEQELAAAREAHARDEQILALGNLAASAAHKLGTPLGTLRILVDEVAGGVADASPAQADLALMREQIEHCKQILGGLTARAGNLRAEGGGALSAQTWLEGVAARWRALRPHSSVQVHCAPALRSLDIVADATLAEALHTLINNAADACPAGVELSGGCEADELVVTVADRGPGIAPGLAASIGREPLGDSATGMGIGLFLAQAAVARAGGRLLLTARPGGGTMAIMKLPLQRIRA